MDSKFSVRNRKSQVFMVKYDFLTPENLRIDGRRSHEIRPTEFELGGIVAGADGSASVSMGLTKV